MRRVIEREPHALQRDQAVGELVLDRLEFADRLPELLALLGIVHRQLEGAPGSATGASHQGKPGFQHEIVHRGALQPHEARGHCISLKLLRPRRHPLRGWASISMPKRRQLDDRQRRRLDGHDQVRATARGFDEAQRSARASVLKPDRTGPAAGIESPEGKGCARGAATKSLDQASGGSRRREPDSARLVSAADSIGAGHAARPSSAITTRISRRPPSTGITARATRRPAPPARSRSPKRSLPATPPQASPRQPCRSGVPGEIAAQGSAEASCG